MKKTPTLFTWLFNAPFKFAILLFSITTLMILGYSLVLKLFLPVQSAIPQIPLFILLSIAFGISVYLTIRKLPKIKMDKPSFIAIHNAQIILLFLMFSISTYLLISHQQELFFKLMMIDGAHSGSLLFILILIALYFSFLFGTAVINFYVKIRRIQQFNIPNWKIICSFPFGFGMLWTPGYLLDTKPEKKPSQPIKSKWYSKLINWTLSSNINTISMFVFITIVSSFFIGLAPTLLTFTLALIFGIWSMQIGSKKFEKVMHKRYATTAVIINIIMIIVFSVVYATAPKQSVEISISDTQSITTQGQ